MPVNQPVLPGEVAARLFTEGCILLFKSWTDYQLILAHADNLPEEARDLPEDIANWYVQEGIVYADELEAYLEDFFDHKCHASPSEGTVAAFASDLVHLYHICVRQDSPAYEAFLRAVTPADIAVSQPGSPMVDNDDELSVTDEDDDHNAAALAFGAGGAIPGALAAGAHPAPTIPVESQATQAAPTAQPARRRKPKPTDAGDGWTTMK